MKEIKKIISWWNNLPIWLSIATIGIVSLGIFFGIFYQVFYQLKLENASLFYFNVLSFSFLLSGASMITRGMCYLNKAIEKIHKNGETNV